MSWSENAKKSADTNSSNGDVGSSTESCPLAEGSIRVNVLRNDTGEYIKDAAIEISGPTPGNATTSGSQGFATFDPVDPGDYTIKAKLSSKELEDPEPRKVSLTGGQAGTYVFMVSPPGNLVVKVVEEGKEATPIENASVSLRGPSEEQLSTDKNGETKFEGIPSGGYTASLAFSGENKKRYEVPGDRSITVEAGRDTEETIVVRPVEHWVEIELVDQDGKPFPDEKYEVELPDGRKVTGKLDSVGRAKVDGVSQSGTCKVRFPDLGHEMDVETQGG